MNSMDKDPYAKYVFVDITSPYSGTDHPIGKQTAPVNNIKDARAIADRLGTTNIVDVNGNNISVFEILKDRIESNNNCNFHFDALDWNTGVWIKGLCNLMDELLERK